MSHAYFLITGIYMQAVTIFEVAFLIYILNMVLYFIDFFLNASHGG